VSNRRKLLLRIHALSAVACFLLLGACSSVQVKEAGKGIGASILEQTFILFVFGADELQAHNKREKEEWRRKTNLYRSSFTRESYLAFQERISLPNIRSA